MSDAGVRVGDTVVNIDDISWLLRNDLTARSLHKYEGYNICDRCHEMIFIDKVSFSLQK